MGSIKGANTGLGLGAVLMTFKPKLIAQNNLNIARASVKISGLSSMLRALRQKNTDVLAQEESR